MPHNQGQTLRCLVAEFQKLDEECRQELLRVAELQSDDYHNDRQLYYACREDRENLCPHVKAGEGRVYHCLFRHKFAREMSDEVRINHSTKIYDGTVTCYLWYSFLADFLVDLTQPVVTRENWLVEQNLEH